MAVLGDGRGAAERTQGEELSRRKEAAVGWAYGTGERDERVDQEEEWEDGEWLVAQEVIERREDAWGISVEVRFEPARGEGTRGRVAVWLEQGEVMPGMGLWIQEEELEECGPGGAGSRLLDAYYTPGSEWEQREPDTERTSRA